MAAWVDRVPNPRRLAPWLALVALEGLLLTTYYATTPTQVIEPRYAIYPFVWINLGIWAVVRTPIRSANRRTTLLASVVAIGYFLVLAWVTGLVSIPHHAGGIAGNTGVTITEAPPGWGPRLTLVSDVLQVVVVPYRTIGFAGLAVLVYDGVLDAAASTVSGVAGLFSCLGCAFPLVSSTLATLGGSSALILAVRQFSVDLSTLAFVLAVGLHVWRPSPAVLSRGVDPA